ncbi:MAG: type II toxin-antitoxin system VapB family antitoxin [Gemmatimonadota bacterium]
MALNIKSDAAHRLAKELAQTTGTTVTDAVTTALRDRVQAEAKRDVADETLLLAEVREVQRLVAALPDRDARPAEEILGYDSFGLPR